MAMDHRLGLVAIVNSANRILEMEFLDATLHF